MIHQQQESACDNRHSTRPAGPIAQTENLAAGAMERKAAGEALPTMIRCHHNAMAPSERPWLCPTRQRMPGWQLALALGLMLVPLAVATAEGQIDRLKRLATEQARAIAAESYPDATRIEVSVDDLDSRLRLEPCDHQPRAQPGPGANAAGRTSLKVRCDSPQPWQLYIAAEVQVLAPVWVVDRSIGRGDRITRDHLRQESRNIAELRRPSIKDPKNAVGRTVRRRVHAGRVLSSNVLKRRRLIERGQRVTIRTGSGGLAVKMGGETLQSGRRGDRIRVRNSSSDKIIEAKVIDENTVEIGR